MATEEVLSLLLTARYVGSPAFSSMSSDIDALVKSASGLAKVGAVADLVGTAMTAAGIGVAAFAAESIKQYDAYNAAVNRLVAVHALASNQVSEFNQIVMQTSDQFGQSSTDIANGLYVIMSGMQALGYTAKDVFKANLIPSLGAFVAASGNGLPGSVSWQTAATDVLHVASAFSLPVSQWPQLMAQMTATENSSGITQSNLVQAVLRASSTANEVGLTPPELLATIGAMGTAGVVDARAGTELASGLRSMLTNSTSLKALASIGLSPGQFFDKKGNLDDPGAILGSIFSRISTLPPAQRFGLESKIFGAVGNRALGQLMNPQVLGTYNRLMNKEVSGGVVANMFGVAGQQLSNFNGAVLRLKQAVLNLMRTVGGPLAQAIQPLISKLAAFLDKVNGFLQKPAGQNLLAKAPQLIFGTATGLLTAGPALQLGGSTLRDFATHQEEKHRASLKAVERWSALGKRGLKPQVEPTPGEKLVQELLAKPAHNLMSFGKKFSPLHAGAAVFNELKRRGGLARDAFQASRLSPFALGEGRGSGGLFSSLRAGAGGALPEIPKALGFLKSLPKNVLSGFVGAIRGLGPALASAVPAALSFGSAMIPIIAVALLIAGAITIAVLAFVKFRPQVMSVINVFKSAFIPVFGFVRSVVLSVLKSIETAWSQHSKQINAAMQALFAAMKQAAPFFEGLGFIIGAVISIIVKVIGYLVTAFISALPYIIGVFTNIFKFLGDLARIVTAVIHGNWAGAWAAAKQALADAWGVIKSLVQAMWTFITSVFKNLWNDIKGPLGGLWNNLVSFFKNLGGAIKKSFGDAMSGIGTQVHNVIATLPAIGGLVAGHHAAGGYIPYSQLSWVGERGPELIRLPGGSQVYSHRQSVAMSTPIHRMGSAQGVEQHLQPLRVELSGLVDAIKALTPQRPPAEEYFYARGIQLEREQAWNRYPNTSREFDNTYRRAYQYYG